jgi:hypothetical protein
VAYTTSLTKNLDMASPRKVIKAWKEPLILGMLVTLEVKVVCKVFSSNMHILNAYI